MALISTDNTIDMESLSDKDLMLIEDYLNGQLPAPEAAYVRKRMEEDPAFSEELKWMEQMMQLKDHQKAFNLLDTFQDIHRKKQDRKRKLRLYVLLAAAAILAMVIFFVLKYSNNKPEPPQALVPAEQATQDQPVDPSKPADIQPPKPSAPPQEKAPENPPAIKKQATAPPIAENTTPKVDLDQYITYKDGIQTLGDDSALGDIRALMDAGKRKEALPLLEKYLGALPEGEEDFDLELEAGKIWLKAEKNYAKAAAHFKKVAEGDVILRYKMEAQFYLACTYLAQGNTPEAKKLLQSVSEQPLHPWKTQAERLLQDL